MGVAKSDSLVEAAAGNAHLSTTIKSPEEDLAPFGEAAGESIPTDVNGEFMKNIPAPNDDELSDDGLMKNNSGTRQELDENELFAHGVDAADLTSRINSWVDQLPRLERDSRITSDNTNVKPQAKTVSPEFTPEKLREKGIADEIWEKNHAIAKPLVTGPETPEIKGTPPSASPTHTGRVSSASSTNTAYRMWQSAQGANRLKEARLELLKELKFGDRLRDRVNPFDGSLIEEMISVFDPAPRVIHGANIDNLDDGQRLAIDKDVVKDRLGDPQASNTGMTMGQDIEDEEDDRMEEVNEDEAYRQKVWEQIQMCRARHGGL